MVSTRGHRLSPMVHPGRVVASSTPESRQLAHAAERACMTHHTQRLTLREVERLGPAKPLGRPIHHDDVIRHRLLVEACEPMFAEQQSAVTVKAGGAWWAGVEAVTYTPSRALSSALSVSFPRVIAGGRTGAASHNNRRATVGPNRRATVAAGRRTVQLVDRKQLGRGERVLATKNRQTIDKHSQIIDCFAVSITSTK